MATVTCPSCRKRISDVTAMCPLCGFKRGVIDEKQLREFERRALRDRIYHLKMISYVAIALFLAALGWYWWQSAGFQRSASAAPVLSLTLGALAYLVIRIMMYAARRRFRRLMH